jgi:hypothetical protein
MSATAARRIAHKEIAMHMLLTFVILGIIVAIAVIVTFKEERRQHHYWRDSSSYWRKEYEKCSARMLVLEARLHRVHAAMMESAAPKTPEEKK